MIIPSYLKSFYLAIRGCLTVPGMMAEIALVGRAIMPNAT